MEKKKVDYSKDIQITNPKTNETFPARLLVNDPEFGVIVGFTDNDGIKWVHSEYCADYESVQETCELLGVSNVPELELKVGDVIENNKVAVLIVSLDESRIWGLDSKGNDYMLERKDSFRLVTGDEAVKFRISIAVNSGKILFSNCGLIAISSSMGFNKVVLDNSTWLFELAEIKENGDIMASRAVNVDTGIIIPTSTLKEMPFADLNTLANAKSFEKLILDNIALREMFRK